MRVDCELKPASADERKRSSSGKNQSGQGGYNRARDSYVLKNPKAIKLCPANLGNEALYRQRAMSLSPQGGQGLKANSVPLIQDNFIAIASFGTASNGHLVLYELSKNKLNKL